MRPGNPIAKNLLLLLFVLVSPFVSGQSASEKFVLDLSKNKFDWLIGRQYDSLEKTLDDRVQYIHSNGWIQNKREIIDDAKSGKLVYQKVLIKEASVRVYGKSAVVTGLGTFEGINTGNPFSIELRYTEVYVKTGSRWKLASRHSNRMP